LPLVHNLNTSSSSKLNSITKKEGQVIWVDTGDLYFDNKIDRVKISDFIDLETTEERLAIVSPSDKYYFVKSENALYRYSNGWIRIGSKEETPFEQLASPSGTAQFSTTSNLTTIVHNNNIANSDYNVFISPVYPLQVPDYELLGTQGEIWVVNKTKNSFGVVNTGTSNAYFDWQITLRTPVSGNATGRNSISGSNMIPANETTKVIGLGQSLSSTDYLVLIIPNMVNYDEDKLGRLGEYWVANKTTSSFTIVSTSSIDFNFDYTVIY